MKTKQYVIKITGSDKDHKEARQQIEELFTDLNKQLPADMEIYIQTVESKPEWERGYLYSLSNKNKVLAL
ncbi:MAG: hypothetical protein PHW73_01740 [Atribacterota bacterium]|nr:hypothetical protein [Atribacterota bacterium]